MCSSETFTAYGDLIPEDYDATRDGGWREYGNDDLTGGERYRDRAAILAAVRAGETESRRDVFDDDLTDEQRRAVREWVSDLESGTIPQGRGKMRDGVYRCCLAVACETNAARIAGVTFTGSSFDDSFSYEFWGETNRALLPDGVSNLFGLGYGYNPVLFRPTGDLPFSMNDEENGRAATLNDRYRLTFREIAEVLRDYYRDDRVWVQ